MDFGILHILGTCLGDSRANRRQRRTGLRVAMRFLPLLMAVAALSCSPDTEKTDATPSVPPRQTIETLVRQAASFQEQKQADSALAYARRADSLAADSPGDTPARLQADINYLLGRNHYEQKSYDSAEVHLEKALAIAEENRADTLQARILYQLGRLYLHQHVLDTAGEYMRRALALDETIYGPNHQALVDPLLELIMICYRRQHYWEAEPLCFRLIAIVNGSAKPDLWSLSEAYMFLGWAAEVQMQFGTAIAHYRKAISIAERQSPIDYENLARLYGVSSLVYSYNEDFAAAEEAALQGLAIAEKHLGPNHPTAALIMTRLLTIYSNDGRYQQAESYARRALAIRQAQSPADKDEVIESMFALGYVYRMQHRYTEAAAYYRRACDMTLEMYGPDDAKLAWYRLDLAEIYDLAGRLTEAEKLYETALPVSERIFGLANGTITWAIYNLSKIWTRQGRYAEAESLLLAKLDALERTYGSRCCHIGTLLKSLANFYWEKGVPDKVFEYGQQLLALRQDLAEKVFVLSSENQKLSWVRQNPLVIPSLLALAAEVPRRYSDSVAFDMVLNGKAIVCDAVMQEKAAAYCSADSSVREGMRQRTELCTAIADLAVGDANAGGGDSLREHLAHLYDSLETVESELSRRCSDFNAAMAERMVTCTRLADFLPPGGRLLEFVQYESDTAEPAGESDQPVMGYLVFILSPAGEFHLIDLGDASAIDSLVTEARRLIYDAEERVYSPAAPYLEERLREVTGELYRRLIVPVDSFLAGASTLLIAPDGMLNLLPFEILATANESYLIEQYLVSYVSSGRDVLRFDPRSVMDGEALIVGDPDYNRRRTVPPSPGRDDPSLLASADVAAEGRESAFRTRGGRGRFTPLQYSREESRAIASSLRQTNRLTVRERYGVDAGEDNVKGMTDPPYILHFSTHGYFTAADSMAELAGTSNPLLRSGLGLAGANSPPPDSMTSDDGLLTALEVSGLNLQGTALVTLSACESGVGEPSAGEGVFGLRRAFLHAGAQSLVMSLWKVPDRETAELMKRFYELWLGGMSRAEALRASALEILRKSRLEKGHGYPLFWGGFVLIGNPH